MLGAEPQAHVTLPPAPERDWLIARTTELVTVLGHVGYVRAPLLEPTPEFFPDAWAGGEASVRRVLLRLLRWADAACAPTRGLGALDVAVVLHPSDPARRRDVVGQPPALRGQDPKAWFVRLDAESGVAHFAVEEIALREVDNLVPALARAVAHCVRAVYGLTTPLDVAGQRLIDITTFPLGFGLLTTDACVRFHTRASGGFRSTRAESRLGALGIQDMSFLLGLQTHVRALDRRARKRVLAHLQPNQAEFVREAWQLLETGDRLGVPVREQLGVPPPDRWPAARPLALLLGPPITTRPRSDARDEHDADDENDEDDDARPDASATLEQRRDVDPGIVGLNRGKPVFRIERNAALRMAKLLGVPILLLGGLLSRGNLGVDLPMHVVMPSAAALALLGLGVGSFFTDRRCSEPKCSRALDVDDEVCPLCGGTVMGVIHDARERLGAEEELVRQGKVGPDGMLVDADETA
jgi:hypothetical protein